MYQAQTRVGDNCEKHSQQEQFNLGLGLGLVHNQKDDGKKICTIKNNLES